MENTFEISEGLSAKCEILMSKLADCHSDEQAQVKAILKANLTDLGLNLNQLKSNRLLSKQEISIRLVELNGLYKELYLLLQSAVIE